MFAGREYDKMREYDKILPRERAAKMRRAPAVFKICLKTAQYRQKGMAHEGAGTPIIKFIEL